MDRFEKMLRAAAEEAQKSFRGVSTWNTYQVLVTRCYRDGYPYYRQRWSKDGERITKAEAKKALSEN